MFYKTNKLIQGQETCSSYFGVIEKCILFSFQNILQQAIIKMLPRGAHNTFMASQKANWLTGVYKFRLVSV